MNYYEQLRHPNWQRRRLEALKRADFCCQSCGDGESPLHVHHRRYVKGRKVWEYSEQELVTLCENCHGVAHESRETLMQVALLATVGAVDETSLAMVLAGYLSAVDPFRADIASEQCVKPLLSEYRKEFDAGAAAGMRVREAGLQEIENERAK